MGYGQVAELCATMQALQSKTVSQDEVISYVRDLQASDPDYHPPENVADILRCFPLTCVSCLRIEATFACQTAGLVYADKAKAQIDLGSDMRGDFQSVPLYLTSAVLPRLHPKLHTSLRITYVWHELHAG